MGEVISWADGRMGGLGDAERTDGRLTLDRDGASETFGRSWQLEGVLQRESELRGNTYSKSVGLTPSEEGMPRHAAEMLSRRLRVL